MKPEDFLNQQSDLTPEKKLAAIVGVLTGPQGCPWDRKQTAESIIDYVIDEAHELKEALDSDDRQEVNSELGDLLFTVQFLTRSLRDRAPLEGAVDTLVEKMVRRHPHVFDQEVFADESELKRNWEAEKRKESSRRKRFDHDIPASTPPLKKATKVLARATNAGFRYRSPEDCWDKVCEEFEETERALLLGDESLQEEELGDLFLALLTLCRMKKISPENALAGSAKKLCDRLERLEEKEGRNLEEIPYEELGPLYQEVKGPEQPEGGFFNYSGVGVWPRPVRRAVRRASQLVASKGLTGALALREERESFREELRDFAGAAPDTPVVFVPNVSTAAQGVAFAQHWEKGDGIVLGRGEFPANTIPWKSAAECFHLNIHWFDEDLLRTEPEDGWARLEALLQEQSPQLLALSAVSFWSGFRANLKRLGKLCSRLGCRLYIDAIQSFGTAPTFMEPGITYLAGGSHKALTAPEGAGFLLVDPTAAQDWQPRHSSWLSLPEPVDFLLNGKPDSLPNNAHPRVGDPTVLEGGSVNTIGYAGLRASINSLREVGIDTVSERILTLQDPLREHLTSRGWHCLASPRKSERSAILSFRPPEGVNLLEVHQRLGEAGFSTGTPNGCLRFGFHTYTKASEVSRVIEFLS